MIDKREDLTPTQKLEIRKMLQEFIAEAAATEKQIEKLLRKVAKKPKHDDGDIDVYAGQPEDDHRQQRRQ